MTKYLLLLFYFSCFFFKSFSQVKGEYKGLYTQKPERYKQIGEKDSIVNGKKTRYFIMQQVEWDGEKKLILKSKGKYVFQYFQRGEPCAARTSNRNCSGQYKKYRDTLYLTSKYRDPDFYKVTEKIIDTMPKGRIMIIVNYPEKKLTPKTFINGFDLTLNDSLIGEFKVSDTIYCAAIEARSLFFSCCSPYQMEWNYIPKSRKSNFFDVTLIREIDGENIFMDNSKLLLKKKNLIVVEGEYLKVKDNLFIKN